MGRTKPAVVQRVTRLSPPEEAAVSADELRLAAEAGAAAAQALAAGLPTWQPRAEDGVQGGAPGVPVYAYTQIKELQEMRDNERVNIIGFVVAVNNPRQTMGHHSNKMVSIRIADVPITGLDLPDNDALLDPNNPFNSAEQVFERLIPAESSVSVNVFAREFQQLPRPLKRFDVIRFHRATKKSFYQSGERYINLAVTLEPTKKGYSSFVLYNRVKASPDWPYGCSHASFSNRAGEVQLLDDMRVSADTAYATMQELNSRLGVDAVNKAIVAQQVGGSAALSNVEMNARAAAALPTVTRQFVRKLADLRRVPVAVGTMRVVELHVYVAKIFEDTPCEDVSTLLLWDGTDIAPAQPVPHAKTEYLRRTCAGPPHMGPLPRDGSSALACEAHHGIDAARMLSPTDAVSAWMDELRAGGDGEKALEDLITHTLHTDSSGATKTIKHTKCPRYGSFLTMTIAHRSPYAQYHILEGTQTPAEKTWVRLRNVGICTIDGGDLRGVWLHRTCYSEEGVEILIERENKKTNAEAQRQKEEDKAREAEKKARMEAKSGKGKARAAAADAGTSAGGAAGASAAGTKRAPTAPLEDLGETGPPVLTTAKHDNEPPSAADMAVYAMREESNDTARFAPGGQGVRGRYVCAPTADASAALTKYSTLREVLLASPRSGAPRLFRVRCLVSKVKPADRRNCCKSFADVHRITVGTHPRLSTATKADEGSFTYAIRFVLNDPTGSLEANLVGAAAAEFFQHLQPPQDLASNAGALSLMEAACDTLTGNVPFDAENCEEWFKAAEQYKSSFAQHGKAPAWATVVAQPWCDVVLKEVYPKPDRRCFAICSTVLGKDVCANAFDIGRERRGV